MLSAEEALGMGGPHVHPSPGTCVCMHSGPQAEQHVLGAAGDVGYADRGDPAFAMSSPRSDGKDRAAHLSHS